MSIGWDQIKVIANTLKEAGKIEQYQQILDLLEQQLEMQKRLTDLEQVNKQLQDKLEIHENLFYERNSYWIKKENQQDGPFCSRCWDDEKKTIRMQPHLKGAYFDCPNCASKNVLVYPENNSPTIARQYIPRSSR